MSSTGTELKNRRWMESMMRRVRFVDFDRFVVGPWNGEQAVTVYGWIDREDDYKDFLLIIFWPESEEFYFQTSSTGHSSRIYRALTGHEDEDEHNECQRVEDEFNVENAITMEDA